MRKTAKFLLLGVVVLFSAFCVYFLADQFGFLRKSQIIVMTDKGFQPAKISIKKNTRVVFMNKGKNEHWPASDLHPTHGIFPEFDPLEGIVPDKEWSFVFRKAGKWRFHDHLVPELRGEIIVNQ